MVKLADELKRLMALLVKGHVVLRIGVGAVGVFCALAVVSFVARDAVDPGTVSIAIDPTIARTPAGLATSDSPAAGDNVGSILVQHGYEMVRIAPGEFWMGSPSEEEGRFDDETRHHVSMKRGFTLGTTEVTQALYEGVMGVNPSHFEGARNPVENVSWYDAVAFCNRLSDQEGLEPAYRISGETVTWDRSAEGYRLPTEAEWEYAARAGGEHVYSGSDDIDTVGWYHDNSGHRTHAVGEKQANDWGLYDMTGNVWEWGWDCFAPYPRARVTDPVGPAGSNRVRRGGSWFRHPRRARVAYRHSGDPESRNLLVGFRLARSVQP